MILVADCGSTKIDWGLASSADLPCKVFTTEGVNATILSPESLREKLILNIPREVKDATAEISELWFYAAGCRTSRQKVSIGMALSEIFPSAAIHVDSDLIGAARSLCGHTDGIACILGTGSNSCVYSPANGGKIIASVSPLGYILGDEGSGTAIGKSLLADYLKGIMPEKERELFSKFVGIDADKLIERVYRGDAPNRFLASLARFAVANIGSQYVESMVENCFRIFFERNVCRLPNYNSIPIHFTGSIAAKFEPQLRTTAAHFGLTITSIVSNPLEQLVKYHLS